MAEYDASITGAVELSDALWVNDEALGTPLAVTLNPEDKDPDITLSDGNLTMTSGDHPVWGSVRAKEGKISGKWYWEVTMNEDSSLGLEPCYGQVGVAHLSADLNKFVGSDAAGHGWGCDSLNGNKHFENVGTSYANPGDECDSDGDIMMVALDVDEGEIWFGKNGSWYFSGNPATGANPAWSILYGTLYPMLSAMNEFSMTINFGLTPFTYDIPLGFQPFCGGPAESVGITDALGVLSEYNPSQSEAATSDDTLGVNAEYQTALSEGATIDDSTGVNSEYQTPLNENLTSNDAITAFIEREGALNESFSINDAMGFDLGKEGALSEAVDSDDSIESQTEYQLTQNEDLTIDAYFDSFVGDEAETAEGFTVNDAITTNLELYPSLSEGVAIQDDIAGSGEYDVDIDGVLVSWNPDDKDYRISLSNGDLTAYTTGTGVWQSASARVTEGKASGKWYWEVAHETVNWPGYPCVGIATASADLAKGLGTEVHSWTRIADGRDAHNNSWTGTIQSFTTNDVVMVALDLDNGKVWFGVNGVWGTGGNPAAGTTPDYSGISGTIFAAISLYHRVVQQVTANFGASAFSYSPPAGFEPYGGILGQCVTISDLIESYQIFNVSITEGFTSSDVLESVADIDAGTDCAVEISDAMLVSLLGNDTLSEVTANSDNIEVQQVLGNNSLSEGCAISDGFECEHVLNLTAAETILVYDAATTVWTETLSDTIDITDALSPDVSIPVSESLGFAETLHNNWEGVEVVQSWAELVPHVFPGWAKVISDGIDITDSQTLEFYIAIHDLLTFGETLAANWEGGEALESIIKIVAATAMSWAKTITDGMDITDAALPDLGLLIKEFLDFSEALTTNWEGTETLESVLRAVVNLAITWPKTISDSIDITDDPYHDLHLLVQEFLSVTETLSSNWVGVEVVESLIRIVGATAFGWSKTISDGVDITDSTIPDVSLLIQEFLKCAETLVGSWNGTESIESILDMAASIAFSWPKTAADSIDITDAALPDVTLLIQELIKFTETLVSRWQGTEALESLLKTVASVGFAWPKTIADGMDITDLSISDVTLLLREFLRVTETLTNNWTGVETVQSTLSVVGQAIVQQLFNETASSEIEVTDLPAYLHEMISVIADTMDFGETLNSQVEFNSTITEAMAISGAFAVLANLYNTNAETFDMADAPYFGWEETVADGIDATDTLSMAWACILLLTDSVEMTETVLGQFNLSDVLTDALEFATTLTLNQLITSTVEDVIHFGVVIELDDELWECWVLNTNAFHASVYSGFSFNSYAVYNNTAYGCKPGGIYKLSGDTDAGSAIVPGIVLPETYLGTNRKKKFRKAFFGLSGGTTPSLRVETDSGSKTYTISNSKANMTRDMYGRTWTLKVQDFDDLDFIELWPVILSR